MTLPNRARQPAQKEERRRAILEAALELWQESAYDEFKMAELASRLGFAKGTLYLYFETKEELFLALLEGMLGTWLAELAIWCSAIKKPSRPRLLAELITRSLRGKPHLLRLLPMLETLLERSSSYEAVAGFQRRLLDQLSPVADAVSECLPQLPREACVRLMLHLRALMMGMFQRSQKPQVMQRIVSENPEYAVFVVDFESEFTFAAEALIEGYLRVYRRASRVEAAAAAD